MIDPRTTITEEMKATCFRIRELERGTSMERLKRASKGHIPPFVFELISGTFKLV
jgi:hypothetical protein